MCHHDLDEFTVFSVQKPLYLNHFKLITGLIICFFLYEFCVPLILSEIEVDCEICP